MVASAAAAAASAAAATASTSAGRDVSVVYFGGSATGCYALGICCC